MSSGQYQLGDLVWAKMKGFCPWPGRVSNPPPQLKLPKNRNSKLQFVYFFGSNNYGLVKDDNIKPYIEHKDKIVNKMKSANFKYAVEQIEEYIKSPENFKHIDRRQQTVSVDEGSTLNGTDDDSEVTVVREYVEDLDAVTPECNVEVKIERVDIVECESCEHCFTDQLEYRAHRMTVHGYTRNGNRSDSLDNKAIIKKESKNWKQKGKRKPGKKVPKKYLIDADIKTNTHPILRNSENQFMCPICEKTFKFEIHAKIHLRVHTGERPYACNLCDRKFTQGGALNIHLRRHAGILEDICPYCNKGFPDKGTLKRHQRTHTGVKPYQCEYCEKKFSDPSAYKCHERTHTGEKPYQCKYCSRSFGDSSAFIQHRRRHHGSREISCAICDKMFFTKYEMKKHVMTVHSAIKPFECHECGKRFAVKQPLAFHIKVKHMVKS